MKELLNKLSTVYSFLKEKLFVYQQAAPSEAPKAGAPKPKIDLSGQEAQEQMLAAAEEEGNAVVQSLGLDKPEQKREKAFAQADKTAKEVTDFTISEQTEKALNQALVRLDKLKGMPKTAQMAVSLDAAVTRLDESDDKNKYDKIAKLVSMIDYEYGNMLKTMSGDKADQQIKDRIKHWEARL